LQDLALKLAETAGIPIAATLLGKGVVGEMHPLYMGLYEGAIGREEITRYVEASDCLIMLGTFMTDMNLGMYSAEIDIGDCIYATSEQLRIRHHHYHDVLLQDFLERLVERGIQRRRPQPPAPTEWNREEFVLEPQAPITITRLIRRLDEQLTDSTIVVADVGDSLFASMELTTHNKTEFLAPAYYTSMGFATPATLGAQVARPEARVVAIVGDGAFQMTGMELSTLVRMQKPAIVIVLNNRGYGTERLLHPGEFKFNDIPVWQYDKLPEVFGGGTGYEVRTEGEFDEALTAAWDDRSGPSIIHVRLDVNDASPALRRMGAMLQTRVVQSGT
jgi:indolepyruvate decarboxylase